MIFFSIVFGLVVLNFSVKPAAYGLPSLGFALAVMGQPRLAEGGHTSRDLVALGSLGPPRGAHVVVNKN